MQQLANTDSLRRNREALALELQATGVVLKGNACKCPFHDDQHASAGIYADDCGVWRFKCQACGVGGDVFDVRAKGQGKPLAEILREVGGQELPRRQAAFETIEQAQKVLGANVHRFTYAAPNTERVDLVVFRVDTPSGKTFRQLNHDGKGWVFKAPPKPWPLYNRGRLAEAEAVVVVEGEKCVHALHDVGIVATTSPCGAGKAEYANWRPLSGKNVILWPDKDDQGIQHMRQVVQLLTHLEPRPRMLWLDPAGLDLPEHGDAADYVAKHGDLNGGLARFVRETLETAEPVGHGREVKTIIEDTISGKRAAIEWPWRRLGKLTKALLPGTVTLLCGDPGAAKSFMLLEAFAYWHSQGFKVAVFQLEEDRRYHLHRALAQRAECSDLLDDQWVRDHPDETRAAWEQHADFLDSFGDVIHEASGGQISIGELAEWVAVQAQAGCRIIAVDPVTMADSGSEPWRADGAFLDHCKKAIGIHGASLVLLTHPKKGRKTAVGLDELAGGAAYQRFAQTVLWLSRNPGEKSAKVETDCGPATIDLTHTLHIAKTRNGKGHGLALGYVFHGESLRMAEQGIIIDGPS